MPAISVIIPIYNVEKYLRRCLDSVKNQTFPDWEAICVNDGSPDNSAEILEEYAKKDARFKIVNKENGGLSDARNAGMAVASGKYILYLDSDDFIHPQTMEIAYSLALRDGSDIVSFTYDRIYRPQLMVRHVLKMDTDNVVPCRIHKRYDVARIPTLVTDDVYEYATERTHNAPGKKKKWLIKHCQVWKNLYRRELIADIPFIKGILFEDFPWWSTVMLKSPTMTITYLPFYYYYPNFDSIDLGSSRVKKTRNWCRGLDVSYRLYREKATDYQMNKWSQNCKWPVISSMIARWLDKFVPGSPEYEYIWETLSSLWEEGAFNDAQTDRDINSAEKLRQFLKR